MKKYNTCINENLIPMNVNILIHQKLRMTSNFFADYFVPKQDSVFTTIVFNEMYKNFALNLNKCSSNLSETAKKSRSNSEPLIVNASGARIKKCS